ncbi:MAG: addiction module protein [Desulfobacteraceae bacterium 4572_130]|nr:MAG: addiction module protein [Desulfobacteraceae bacterium 4572_130]
METPREFIPDILPVKSNFLSKKIYKAVIEANKALAELKGVALTIPNQVILFNSLALQEAKDSSEIENIITTHDELFRAMVADTAIVSKETKEVQQYREAVRKGFENLKEHKIFTVNHILEIQSILLKNDAGVRKLPGTMLKNDKAGQIILVSPQEHQTIINLFKNLEKYINDDSVQDIDPTIKMAIIHYQFESIHPFYDGNGRTGRIINILYLILKDLLDLPILYLSRYIIKNKSDYYYLLQEVRTKNNWDEWILFMLSAIQQTSKETIQTIHQIRKMMLEAKDIIRKKESSIYSKDLLEVLFNHPYTKIHHVAEYLSIHRQTASKYLNKLTKLGILDKVKLGKENYYINVRLYNLFKN